MARHRYFTEIALPVDPEDGISNYAAHEAQGFTHSDAENSAEAAEAAVLEGPQHANIPRDNQTR